MSLIVTPHQLEQRAELYHQLGSLISAGITLQQALEQLFKNPPSRAMRQPISRLISQLQTGQTFAEAMHATGKWTPVFDTALLQAGEQSGRLDSCFHLLAEYYRSRAAMARELISSLIYPVLLLHFAVLIFPVGLLPRLVWEGDFVPFILQKLAVLLPLYAIALFIVIACQGNRSDSWRVALENFSDHIPLIGTARRQLALARLAAALEALISAGVSIFDAWELAAAASGSPSLRKIVFSWRPRLEAGETPAQALATSPRFPDLFSNLYHSGEISGQQDQALRRLHQYYQEQGTHRMRQISQWVPRAIYFLIVIAIAYAILQFWHGYFAQIQQVLN